MKYGAENAPLVCMQTRSACYRGTKPMTVRGVLWHSTGVNNPNLSRYIQPADDDPDREELAALLGGNRYSNDYNHGSSARRMGVNAWIGKLSDGTVAAVQAMPWGWKPWGCGEGVCGSLNDGWIQFEICEDDLRDGDYARSAYEEACELTAYLCGMYHLDPMGTASYRGREIPVILDHRTSHLLGFGSNHGDVGHWFSDLYGRSMDDVRADVAALMRGGGIRDSALKRGMSGEGVRSLQSRLIALGYDLGKWGADGEFGAATESAVKAFQRANGLEETGIAEAGLLSLMEGMAEAARAAYTVVLRDLDYADMARLRERWPDCEVMAQ